MYPSLFLIATVAVGMAAHMYRSQREAWREFVHAWNEKERVDGDYAPKHREIFHYHWHRFRRRMGISLLMGIVGVLLPLAWYVLQRRPSFGVFLWAIVICLLLWMIVLAGIDAGATYFYYLHVRDDLLVERTKLEVRQKRAQTLMEEESEQVNE